MPVPISQVCFLKGGNTRMRFSFNDFSLLEESKGKKAFLVFGRFSPCTKAHLMLLNELGNRAKKEGGVAFVFTSHTNDTKKNPLPYKKKIFYLKKLAKLAGNGVKVIESAARNGPEAISELGKTFGYTDVVMATGSDRAKVYSSWKKYTKDFGIKTFDVMVVGKERNDTSDDLDGMSASKMRKMVADGKEKEFIKNAPFDAKTNKQLYDDVKKGMGI